MPCCKTYRQCLWYFRHIGSRAPIILLFRSQRYLLFFRHKRSSSHTMKRIREKNKENITLIRIGELKKVFSPVHHENLRALLQYSAKEFADTTAFIVKTKKKKEVSDTLTKVLKTKQLKRRQCPDCGRALPYNYQYGICESCYS